MAQQKEQLVNPGDVMLEKCEIESITGDRYDIIDVLSEINIYEDIFNNGVTGDVFLVDSVNLINMAPIIGQEVIRIRFKTPVIDPAPIRELTFHIYKISKRHTKNDRTQGYVLHFASPATIRNQLVKVGRTISGQISNEPVLKIIQEDLDADVGLIGSTKGAFEFVIPFWSPYKTLNWLAKRAITTDTTNGGDANFVFYETISNSDSDRLNGFEHNFISIGQLMSLPPRFKGQEKYSFGPITRTLEETGKELYPDIRAMYYTINEYEILESMDNMEAISRGMYGSRLVSYDMLTKQISNTSFNYFEDFTNKTRNLPGRDGEQHPLTTNRPNPGGLVFQDFDDANIQRTSEHDLSHTQFPEPYGSKEWMLQRQSSLQQLKMNRVLCVVPGNSRLRAGNVFEMVLPSQGQDAGFGKEDQHLSGRYLVTSLRHKIQKASYFTTMELAKDSFYTQLPESTKNNR